MFSTSMRKCSAVVFRDAPAWFAAEFLSSVFASVPLVIVILLFVLWFFSDSIRSTSRRTATPRSRRRSFLLLDAHRVSGHGGVPSRVCIHRLSYREDALHRAHQR